MINKYICPLIVALTSFCSLSSDEGVMDKEIKHVVVLMLENRSFDNVFAWLYEHEAPLQFIPSDTDPHYMGLSEETLHLYANPLKNSLGDIVFSCAPIKGVPSLAGLNKINSPQYDPHEPFPNVTHQVFDFGDGKTPTMLGFLQDYASLWEEEEWLPEKHCLCGVMETYTEKELPVLCGLAKHYAVSDLWFSSVPTQTNPNRAYSICGTSDGQTVNGGNLGHSIFYSDTLWNRLEEESPDTTWTVFWQSDILEGIIKGPAAGPKTFLALERIPDIDQHFFKIDKFHELARNGQLPAISYLEPQWTISENLDPKNQRLIDIKDLLVGLQGNDLHPPGDVRPGENFVANVYTSLIANPESWNNTLLVITFDEHGGLFDHVPPPAAIPPDNLFQEGFGFDRYGVRVPTIFISPRIERKTVVRSDTPETPFDHTSLIATIFKWKHLPKKRWNMGRRTDIAPTFDSVVTRTEPRQDALLLPENAVVPQTFQENVVYMGEALYLADAAGEHILNVKGEHVPYIGKSNRKAALRFSNGSGKITHGSFVLIEAIDDKLGSGNILEVDQRKHDCRFSHNKHESPQWWTVKSVDHPYVGYEIQYGDRIYLENHVYVNLTEAVPARLVKKKGWFETYLSTKSILAEGSEDNYWIVERP